LVNRNDFLAANHTKTQLPWSDLVISPPDSPSGAACQFINEAAGPVFVGLEHFQKN